MKKSIFSRLTRSILAAIIMTILCSFCTIPASAATVEPVTENAVVAIAEDCPAVQVFSQRASIRFSPLMVAAATTAPATESASGSASADSTYKKVITFFLTWIRRIGALVALIGGIMFAMAQKNPETTSKETAVNTMVAGFIVIAIVTGVNMFDLFS